MANPQLPYDLLRAELERDGARPFVTFYDDASGERIELSVNTFDNWVAKTAGLLRDGLSLAPGDRVALLLPAHWQGLVWAGAIWAVGGCLVSHPDSADVAVAGPETLYAVADAPDVVALSLRPLGGRFTEPLPPGVLDYALEVPGYPDQLGPLHPPASDAPARYDGTTVRTYAELADLGQQRAAELGIDRGGRLLVPTDDLEVALVDALLAPLAAGGSAVLVRHEDAATRDHRVAAERVSAVAAATD
jgi:uncharacterized protein (TIGR03089 family)